MKTIEFKSNFARFAYRMTAEVGEDLTPATTALCIQGLANICYRTVGSNVDKKLGIKSKKNGGDGRNAVLYSVEDGERINTAVSEKLTEMEKDEKTGDEIRPLKLSFAVTGEHEFGTGSEPTKEDEAMWTKVQALPDAELAKALVALKLDEDYDDESGLRACREMRLAAERAAKEAAKKGVMGLLGV